MSRFLIDMPCASFKARFVPGFLRLSVFAFALLLVVPVPSAWAQSSYELGNRIKRLENEIQTLSRTVYRGETPPTGSASGGARSGGADVEIRLQQVERELRELRGLVERESHDVRQIRAEMERITSDLELRLNDLEGGGRSAAGRGSGSSVPYTAGGAGDSQLKPPAGQDDSYQWSSKKPSDGAGGSLGSYGGGASDQAAASYEAAFSLVKNSQYSAAEKGFLSFLERYPKHVLASNAQYWLGETYYVRGKFEKAARVFAEAYQTNPKGTKAADNLLKLGMSLAGLGKTEDACVALQQLNKEKTGASSPVMRRAEQEKARLSCP